MFTKQTASQIWKKCPDFMIELMDYHTDHNNMIINDRLTGKLVSITPQLNSVIEFEEVLDV